MEVAFWGGIRQDEDQIQEARGVLRLRRVSPST
jgi:hypothetical protein